MKRAQQGLGDFIARYSPEIASDLRAARKHLRTRFPRGYELVYDNYNALAFGFSPTPRASDVIVSVAGYPQWATLFFLKGTRLADPERVLQGSGSTVRSVRLQPRSVLRSAPVQALLDAAIAPHAAALEAAPRLSTIIKSISARQRPRRPTGVAAGVARAKPRKRTRASAK